MPVDADAGRAGPAAVGAASSEAGADEDESDESVARVGHGRRAVPEEEVVEPGGSPGTGRLATGAVGRAAAARATRLARSVGGTDCRVESRGRAASGSARASGSPDDASGRGAIDLAGIRADGGPDPPFSTKPEREQLSGSESKPGLFWHSDAYRVDQQAGQFDDALAVGGSRTDSSPAGSGTAAVVSAAEIPAWKSDC